VRAQVLALRARIHSAHHRDAEALADAIEAGRLLIAAGVKKPAVCGWRSQAAVAAAALGDRDRASQLADDELRLARRFGAAPAIGVALTAAGTIASGRKAVELLVEAEAVLDGSGAQLEHARTLAYLGAAFRHHGSQRKARATLTDALNAATSVNAEGVADLARSELRLAGSRPRRDATTGAAALTAAEQRVTELAADGLTNRAIAQELFVTKKTVEWHLRNSFRKLDVDSRDELASVLASDVEVLAAG
jgi:DNA-binding NarL/FixJ family response regulator